MLETLDYKMVTASPIDGFLFDTAEALKPLADILTRVYDWFIFDTNFDNIIFFIINNILYPGHI
jgi:hypothetical protein